ncbi:MAG TPA: SDR family NAD(P)-dependent oxidoreductase, partial [Beutenbergiaceae bacterium]|nr:SDR family NAD(P)-dependent oxidoreductase [Beutenbergiaceae bacterium]
MAQLMEDKAGYVTGAAGGIGRGIAQELAKEGARVVVSDLESATEGGQETVRLIEEAGGRATFIAADVAQPDQVEALV